MGTLRCALGAALLTVSLTVATAPPAWAGTWPVALAGSSSGEAAAVPAPTAPATVTAACASRLLSAQVRLTWPAATSAATYAVYQSGPGATPYTQVATVSGTSTVVTPTALGAYTWEVAGAWGPWQSARSGPSGTVTLVTVIGVGVVCS